MRFLNSISKMPAFVDSAEAVAWLYEQPGFGDWAWNYIRSTGRVRWDGTAWIGVGAAKAAGPLTEEDYRRHSPERFMPVLKQVIPSVAHALSIKPLVKELRRRGVECRETPLGDLMQRLYAEGHAAHANGKWFLAEWVDCEKPAVFAGEQALVNGRWGAAGDVVWVFA